MYLDFETYQTMGGLLDSATFTRLEFMSSKYLDKYTFNRLKSMEKLPTEVTPLMFELVNLLNKHNVTSTEKEIAQMSNNGVQVQYINASYILVKEEVENIVKLYLDGVLDDTGEKILYAGVKNETTFCQ